MMQNKVTSARAHKIIKEHKDRLKRLYKEKRYKDDPGPDGLNDYEILSFIKRHPKFYWTEKNSDSKNTCLIATGVAFVHIGF